MYRQVEIYGERKDIKVFFAVLVMLSHLTLSSFFYGSFPFVAPEAYAADYTLTQNYFRFYVDNDALKPTDPWPAGSTDLGENSAVTANDLPPASGERLRLRMSLQVGSTTLPVSTESFKLQYGVVSSTCAAITSWSDTGGVASSTIWRGFNGTPSDGTSLSGNPPTGGDLLLSVSDRAGSYEEENPTGSNPFSVAVGEDVEYDWALEDNGAAASTTYCFRMVKSDGTALDTYSFYPSVTTSGYRPKTQNWRWYDDENNETPSTALAGENVAPSNIDNTAIVKLRVAVRETANVTGTDIKFRVQYSQDSSFASEVSNVSETGACTDNTGWCYGNGVDADNDAVTTRVLSDTTANGTHNESGTSTSTFDPAASTTTEFEFTLKHSGALVATTYFFRLFDMTNNLAVPVNTGESYPSLVTGSSTLTFTVTGVPSGTSTEGVVTDVTTTATSVNFGSLAAGSPVEAAQRLTVSTNAPNGYTILMKSTQSFISSGDRVLGDVAGTNASPSVWGIPGGQRGAIGYHAGDNSLSGGSTRFSTNDTYARLETTEKEIIFSSVPVVSETTDIVFKVEITGLQDAGQYSTTISYIIVPTF